MTIRVGGMDYNGQGIWSHFIWALKLVSSHVFEIKCLSLESAAALCFYYGVTEESVV